MKITTVAVDTRTPARRVAGRLASGLLATLFLSLPAAVSAEWEDSSQSANASSSGSLNIFKKAGTKTEVTGGQGSPDINAARMAAYDGPKARIAVSRFTDKTGTGWWSGGIGDGMADQLTTALFNSNRFIVLERQALSDVLQEQDLGASGRVRQSTAAAMGQVEGAELLITGAVTEFDGRAAGAGGAAVGGLFGRAGRLIGSLASGYSKAHMAIDVRVIDTSTSRIVAATSVQGEATDVNMGAALLGASGGGALGGSLAAWQNTPIEKALRICINEAVDFIVSKTPQNFYRHGTTTMAAAAQSSAPAAPPPAKPAAREVPDYQPGMIAEVSSSRLNVRSGPGTTHGVTFVLHESDPVLVLDKTGQWIQVKDQRQRTGWTAAWLTTPVTTVSPEIFEGVAAATPAPAPAATPAVAVVPAKAAPVKAETTDLGGPMARLKRVEMLRQQNLISEDEYQKARAKILAEL